MNKDEILNYVVGTLLMTIVVAFLYFYAFSVNFADALILGVAVTLTTIIAHELVHEFVAKWCGFKDAHFSVTRLTVEVTVVAIIVLALLIYVKQTTGFLLYFIPVVASPGGVMIDRIRSSRCGDNIAIAAPFYNFVFGAMVAFALMSVYQPPFYLNDTSNYTVFLLSNISFISLSLAFFNSLPLRFGDVALDGWIALNVDRRDRLVAALTAINIFVSLIILYSGIFAVR